MNISTVIASDDEPPHMREVMEYQQEHKFCKEMAVTVELLD